MSYFPQEGIPSLAPSPTGGMNERLQELILSCIKELAKLLTETADSRGIKENYIPKEPLEESCFPLTDLQQAYFVGEQNINGRCAPALFLHEYAFHANAAPNPDRLAATLSLLYHTHPTLRLSISPEGMQSFSPPREDDKNFLLARHDLSNLSSNRAYKKLAELRISLANDVPAHHTGPPFLFRWITLPGGAVHLQIALRLTAFDGITIQLFFAEIARCYTDSLYRPVSPAITFRDYVLSLEKNRSSSTYLAASQYWESRLSRLPPAVDLPRRSPREPSEKKQKTPLLRCTHRLHQATWSKFRQNAANAGMSAGVALFGLYVESLLRWSGGRAGTVTVLATHRPGPEPEMQRLWGCATTTTLVGYDSTEGTFVERCKVLQDRLYADLEASEVSGVQVGRILQQRRGETGNPVPVTFSSGLDMVEGAPAGFLLPLSGASLAYSAISTPAVLLDHQVYEESGELVCNFDHDESAYPPYMIEELAAYHHHRLLQLAEETNGWNRAGPKPLPDKQLADRRRANSTSTDLPSGELHSFTLDICRRQPAATAVVDSERSLAYGELDYLSGELAVRLRQAGIGGDPANPDLVAVRLPRSYEHVVALLGVLRAGGAYLPLSSTWPLSRIETVLKHSGAVAVVDKTDENLLGVPSIVVTKPAGTTSKQVSCDGLGKALDRVAYVIYTSGSTGMPKGVVISHGAATNTLRDLAKRLSLTQDDRLLAVSSPAFDLSVFDVFGILGTGGTVVIPTENDVPDPENWGELCRRHRITVWNSVPALLGIALEYFGDRAAEMFRSLRLVMLSGDWVPLPLLDHISAVCPSARVIAMGGATEAAIWSNYFWTVDQPDDWSSVPYGYPLANQTMHILDKELADAPTWVPGDLYIGGAGVANGYLHSPDLTKASFLVDSSTGERRYRTGDRARYRPGGIVEFLGREDDQVKIGGHRIELGEIEARLVSHAEVENAVTVVATSREEPYLAAFVTAASATRPDPFILRSHLAEELPPYMVPAVILVIDTLPLNSNGKVDRKSLLTRLPASGGALTEPGDGGGGVVAPRTPEEVRLLELWREQLGPNVRGVTDDFFALGGNSLLAVRLAHRIGAVLGRTLPLASLMRGRTIAEQAAQLVTEDPHTTSFPLVTIRDGAGPEHLVLVHPVGGDVLCYQELVESLTLMPEAAQMPVRGLRSLGLLPGERPAANMTTMVTDYCTALVSSIPEGWIHLVGWSMGGTVALRVAALLEEQGRRVASLTTIDSFTGDPKSRPISFEKRVIGFFSDLTHGGNVSKHLTESPPAVDHRAWLCAAQDSLVKAGVLERHIDDEDLVRLFTVYSNNSEILQNHVPVAHERLFMIRARGTARRAFPGLVPIEETLDGFAPPVWLDANHYSVLRGKTAMALGRMISARIKDFGRIHDLNNEPIYMRSKLWV